MHRLGLLAATAALAFACPPTATAQQPTRLTPQCGVGDDLVLIEGTGLGSTSAVVFAYFFSPTPAIVVPESVSDTEVWVKVPFMAPPGLPPTTDAVVVSVVSGFEYFVDFFLPLEQTGGDMLTYGKGTTPAGAQVSPRIGFDFIPGPPKYMEDQPVGPDQWKNNPFYRPTLHFAPPSTTTFLAIGAPDFNPTVPILDGQLLLDLSVPALFVATSTDAFGEAVIDLPVPATLTGTVGLQWLTVDLNTPGFLVASNGYATTF